MRGHWGSYLAALLVVFASGCAQRLPTQPEVGIAGSEAAQESKALADPVQESKAFRRNGAAELILTSRSGAIHALYRPAAWKGDLVLYAHGFTPPSDPIHLPPIDALRDLLLARGFAVAYSSFAENGLAVRDGIRQTERVEELFAERLGRPRRVFLIGSSFGGLIAVALAERQPEHYDGVLTVSGLIGGARGLIDYVAHVRVLFDVYYPGVLQGDLLHLPPGLNLNQHVIGPAVQAMSANPQGAAIISQVAQTPVPFANGPELVGSIATALSLHFIELDDLLRRTHGESFFDNSEVTYSGPLPAPVLADLNARVARHRSTPEVQRFFDRWYEPSGRLRIPMLALSNQRDPQVNAFNETRYRDRVALRGEAALLEQRSFARYGHSELFTPDAIAAALEELVARAPRQGGDRDHDGDDGDDAGREDDDRDRDAHAVAAGAGAGPASGRGAAGR